MSEAQYEVEEELSALGLPELNELTDCARNVAVITAIAARAAASPGALGEQLVQRAIELLDVQRVLAGAKTLRSAFRDAKKAARKRKPRATTGAESWRADLLLSENGSPIKGVANVVHVFAKHPEWSGVIAWDAFHEHIVKLAPPPVRSQDGQSTKGEWTEDDSVRTATWFASNVGFEPSTIHVEQAVATAARLHVVHPVRDWLARLQWDGTGRLDTMLCRYFGASDTEYARAISSRWMISAVARVMKPGCQADCTLILEGAQGTGKSTGFEALFGSQWFADTGLAIGDKDSYQALRGKWCIELAELDSLKGREVTRIKAFLSARSDSYRPSYARRTRDFPRQVVFAGTTNEGQYLADRTGNRRFWPVRCGAVDVEGLRQVREQIWAETFARYAASEPWHVDTVELRALCEAEQAEREIDDPWSGIVARWLSEAAMRREINPAEGVPIAAIMSGALSLSASDMSHAQSSRIGHVLRQLGWEPRQLRRDGQRIRLYFQPSQPSQPTRENGCDENPLGTQGDRDTSQVSHPHNASPVCARAPAHTEQSLLSRDGCDAVTPDAIDQLERSAIEAEGRGEL